MKKLIMGVAVSCLLVPASESGPVSPKEGSDGASVWTELGPEGGTIQGLARNPKSPNELYAATLSGFVCRSTNGGASWTRTANVGEYLYDLAIDPKNSATIYVLGQYALYKSSNQGATFAPFPFGSDRSVNGAKIAIDPSNSKIIFIGGVSDSRKVLIVLKSTNGGQSWTKKTFDRGYYSAWATGIAVSPKNPATLYFCGYFYDKNVHGRARVYRSTNAGDSWRNITPGNLNSNQALALGISIDPRNPARVFVALNDRVVRSEDSGASWQAQTTPSDIYPNCLTLDQTNLNTLYAGGNRINYKSIDSGKTWSSSAGGLLGIASKILVAGNTVHWGSTAGIFKSLNGGVSFKTSQAGIKALNVCDLSIPASASSAIYAAAENCAVFKTTNRGRSWAKLPDFPVNVEIADLAASDSDPKRVYVSTYG